MADIMQSKQMEGVEPLEQARRAIRHMLEHIKTHPETGYYCGYGSQTYSLLTEAAATLFKRPVDEVRTFFRPQNARDPGRYRLDWFPVDESDPPRDEKRVLVATDFEEVREGYIKDGVWHGAHGGKLYERVSAFAEMPRPFIAGGKS
jgi:hypothetical protein